MLIFGSSFFCVHPLGLSEWGEVHGSAAPSNRCLPFPYL
jgi:hypothetical protein